VIDGGDSIIIPDTDGDTWSIVGDLIVGNSGTGTLNIRDGGTVINDRGYIGRYSDGKGTVIVTGADSIWDSSSYLIVGLDGSGKLRIENGGRVVNNGESEIGYSAYSDGTVTVSGAGSTWKSGGLLRVGREGTGELRIEDGGKVSSKIGRASCREREKIAEG